jgi:mannose-6-phosphate isomerase-like protein (cupin superfamily)
MSNSETATPLANLGPWQDWVRQQLIFTEAVRGGPLVWRAGDTHLFGDPLGPVRHAHDDAAEYYFVLSGACMVEVGGEERVANAGDLVYIPANAPHNLLHEVGGEDAWVYVLVSPNLAHNKWRTSDYLPGSESLRMTVTRPLEGDRASASNPFPADLVEIRRDSPLPDVSRTSEIVYLVAAGECHVRVGRLAGNLGPGGQVHVLRDLDHEISSLTDAASLLRFDCAFVPFAGVPLGPDGAQTQY